MKNLTKVVCWLLLLVTIGTFCACSGEGSKEMTVEERVESAINARGLAEFRLYSIGDNELKSSTPTITNMKKISDIEYHVSGKMVMTDIYGTKWTNTFDCKVTQGEDSVWVAHAFEYTSKSWNKS